MLFTYASFLLDSKPNELSFILSSDIINHVEHLKNLCCEVVYYQIFSRVTWRDAVFIHIGMKLENRNCWTTVYVMRSITSNFKLVPTIPLLRKLTFTKVNYEKMHYVERLFYLSIKLILGCFDTCHSKSHKSWK